MKIQLHLLGLLVVALAAMGLVGCGGADDDEAMIEVEVDSDNVCQAIAEVMCHNIFECCTGKEREEKLGEELTLTEQECVDDMLLECRNEASEQLQAIEKQTFGIDVEAATACVEALMVPEGGGCFTNEVEPAVYALCFDAALGAGLVEDEGDCFWDWECAESSYCDYEFTCVALPTDGEPCPPLPPAPPECADGHYCDFASLHCKTYAGAGDFCIDAGVDTDYPPCDPEGSFCAGADHTTIPLTPGTCTSKFPLGSSCENSGQCTNGQCAQGHCETNPREPCTLADLNCSQGFCQGTTDLCNSDADCGGGTCEKRCVGNVCWSEPEPLDYCHFGLEAPCYVFGDDPDNC